jgi:integrase
MISIKDYRFQSCFAPHIKAFLFQKRLAGFLYHAEEYHLKHFDAFCVEQRVIKPVLTRELVMTWATIRNTEGKSYCSNRVSTVKQFAKYMQSQGIEAYIPIHFYKQNRSVAHVLSDAEILAFFSQVDDYHPKVKAESFIRLSMEYRVLFRLIYCCGLRVSEARKLKNSDFDFKQGIIHIMKSKGRKDRMVYLSQDVLELCIVYRNLINSVYHIDSIWLFPARNPNQLLSVGAIDLKFRQFWTKTIYSYNCDRSPTVHSLRHSFVVKRMNLWMENKNDLSSMMPYLSSYLGHRSPKSTFYYYHQIEETFKIIRDNDNLSSVIIPEVKTYEEE